MDTKRFNAEWITYQSSIDAADCEYESAEFDSYEQAERAAIESSKACNVVEWWSVTEEKYSRRFGWETVNRWVGDWDGNIEQTRGEAA